MSHIRICSRERLLVIRDLTASEGRRLQKTSATMKEGVGTKASRESAHAAWTEIAAALAASSDEGDRRLARSIEAFAAGITREAAPVREAGRGQISALPDPAR